MGFLFTTENMKRRKCKCLNGMKYVYTVLHLVSLVKMNTVVPSKIPNGRDLKNLILQKVVDQ